MLGLLLLFLIIGTLVYWYRSVGPQKGANYNYSIDDRFNADKAAQEKEVDRILEKINKKGIGSLTAQEKDTLERYSQVQSEGH
jgi:hypothetical protein